MVLSGILLCGYTHHGEVALLDGNQRIQETGAEAMYCNLSNMLFGKGEFRFSGTQGQTKALLQTSFMVPNSSIMLPGRYSPLLLYRLFSIDTFISYYKYRTFGPSLL